jgi:hypothetical protein
MAAGRSSYWCSFRSAISKTWWRISHPLPGSGSLTTQRSLKFRTRVVLPSSFGKSTGSLVSTPVVSVMIERSLFDEFKQSWEMKKAQFNVRR